MQKTPPTVTAGKDFVKGNPHCLLCREVRGCDTAYMIVISTL